MYQGCYESFDALMDLFSDCLAEADSRPLKHLRVAYEVAQQKLVLVRELLDFLLKTLCVACPFIFRSAIGQHHASEVVLSRVCLLNEPVLFDEVRKHLELLDVVKLLVVRSHG